MSARHAADSKSKKYLVLGISAAVVCVGLAGSAIAIATTSTSTSSAPIPQAGAFTVLGTTPSSASTVDSSAAIRVSLSGPLSTMSPMPVISPAVEGSWEHLSATTIEFIQQTPFQPGQSVTVTIPGGATGLESTSGVRLASTVTTSFQVAPLSLLRVQQLLAEEGYLPVTFNPTFPTTTAGAPTGDQVGTFSWRWGGLPASLISQWQPGVPNMITRGALMRFEDVHHLATDGTVTPQVESLLLADRTNGVNDPDPYTYVDVSKALPQTLRLYSNGKIVFTTNVNTGIPGQDTANGTYPVYVRYRTTTMSGTNPDGTTYHDEGVPWTSYFNGGDALHGFLRPTYGSPQSLGCVEMTYADAEVVWNQTPLGTLVTVS